MTASDLLPVVDLRAYVLVTMPKSTCPDCHRHIYGLAPRSLDTPNQPFYFLCLCGRNMQAGCAEVIAPTEITQPCPERIWHGPGHQSSTPCHVRGPHETHEAIYGEFNQVAWWQTDPDGKPTFTGAFDEPPVGERS